MRSLHRFLIPGVSVAERIEVPRDEARHIVRVLRLKPGDELAAFDGTGVECVCRIAEQSGRRVTLDVIERRTVSREHAVRVTLAIAASKNKAMDLIVQKCTELGLARLIPFHSGRSVARVDDTDKTDKWRRVAIEAAKQCGRNVLPQIDPPLEPDQIIAAARGYDLALVAALGPQAIPLKKVLHAHPHARSIICIIGPEGGFPPHELDRITAAGIPTVSLGPSVLRVETAAIAILAMIAYHYS
ncbi:MAG TPA: RsmE family RNA methyltransferase [Planctomycetota bacterium]|nr:RsmE family RNA methyltransferase [Planctomycetota bacterium]